MAPFRKFLWHSAITLMILGVLGGLGAAIVVLGGVYGLAALHQHTGPVYTVLDLARIRSIEVRAKGIAPPSLSDPARVERGFRLYRKNCLPCHGAPGVPPEDFGKGMLPTPSNLVQIARERSPEYLYWVVENGIRMTGMPAWKFRLSEEEIWAVVAFLERLPSLSPREYAELEREASGRTPSEFAGPREAAR
jgi:mono/diheme cytochrome c family protein